MKYCLLLIVTVVSFVTVFAICSYAQSITISLAWDPSTSPNIAGYNVYRSNQSGVYGAAVTTTLITGTTYTDVTLQPGQTYFYTATAVSVDGIESGRSNEVRASVPFPPGNLRRR